MKNLLALIILILFPFGIFAQTFGSIYGRILNNDSKESLPGANVWVETGNSLIGTTTDNDGYFKLKPLNPGIYNLHISYIGYEHLILTIVRVNPDKITMLDDIFIRDTSVTGDVFEKTAKRIGHKLIDPFEPTMVTLTDKDFKNISGGKDPSKLISTFSSDIMVSEVGNRVYVRGARDGSVLYIVDGIRTKDASLGVSTSAISSMTIYTGAVPAKYGDFTGGVIVVETKSYFDIESEKIARNMTEDVNDYVN